MEHAVALLRCDGLTARPLYVEEGPPSQCIFREARSGPHRYSQRLYARLMPKPYDVWRQHGGTSVSRVQLPARLQDGERAQVLIRRSGKIVRPANPAPRPGRRRRSGVRLTSVGAGRWRSTFA
eukprot:COSAG04_NODE_14243_length_576_cov_0.605870_2_plen_123_part_00